MASAMMMYFQAGYLFMRLLRVLDGALGEQRRHGAALHLDRHVGRDFQAHVVVVDLRDLAEDADRDHLVALLQRLEHRLVLFRFLHLRADHDEVHHDEHEDDGQEAHQRVALRAGACSLGESGSDHCGVLRGERLDPAREYPGIEARYFSMADLLIPSQIRAGSAIARGYLPAAAPRWRTPGARRRTAESQKPLNHRDHKRPREETTEEKPGLSFAILDPSRLNLTRF